MNIADAVNTTGAINNSINDILDAPIISEQQWNVFVGDYKYFLDKMKEAPNEGVQEDFESARINVLYGTPPRIMDTLTKVHLFSDCDPEELVRCMANDFRKLGH